MKKIFASVLICVLLLSSELTVLANPAVLSAAATTNSASMEYKKNAPTINYAFIFDGPSPKNEAVMAQFKKYIVNTTAPDYKAGFSPSNVFVGDWSESGVKSASDKAMHSNSTMVISLGYLSTKYLNSKENKNKFVVTIDQYGLRDLGDGFFNPVQQSVRGVQLFKRLINFKKTAILMNESFYKTKKDWNEFLKPKLAGIDFNVIPVNSENIDGVVESLSGKYDAVVITPLFNLSEEKKHELFDKLNAKKIPTFSTIGREDVNDGVLLGAGAYDLDRKIAEATSFNIKGVLNGDKAKPRQIQFYEDEIVYINQDTADLIGYNPHLRVLNNAEVISHKKPQVYSLSAVFDSLNKQNLDIERKRLLVKAARRSSYAAMLRYLPSMTMTLGYQQYNNAFADSVKLTTAEKMGLFQVGVEQIIYSPALVTNILVKKKMVDFTKHEQFLTEQNMGIDIALLYIETLMLDNVINVQREEVKSARENLAIARVREKMGKCGPEEALRWATELRDKEQELLDMTAEQKNLKIAMNKLLFQDQTQNFVLAGLKANDPAFYTSEIHIIDFVSTPKTLEAFTKMLVEEAYRVAPELAKLKAAKRMKEYEMAMYYQKFFLPDAKVSLDYTSMINREFAGGLPNAPLAYTAPPGGVIPGAMWTNMDVLRPDATNLRLGVFAQWRPIEGGTKVAEIARIKAEIQELQRYEDEAKTAIEQHIRDTINKALAGYFSIEKNYKGMYAAGENYKRVQAMYLKGDAPVVQMLDAQNAYLKAKVKAMNSQYVFFKELVWVQRGICAVDWTKASPDSHAFIKRVRESLEEKKDIEFL